MSEPQVTEAPKRKGGWPKGKPRGTAAARGHSANGKVVAVGRDGTELTRKRTISNDIFHIPENIIPDGWTYQWNVLTVMGQEQTNQRLSMQENGWRPVPADRHEGLFMPPGYKGPIIRDGLQLEERPAELTEEAKAEERAKARKLVRDQEQQLRLSAKLPPGYSDDPKYRGTGAVARQTYEGAPEELRPRLQIEP